MSELSVARLRRAPAPEELQVAAVENHDRASRLAFAGALALGDFVVLVLALLLAQVVRFGAYSDARPNGPIAFSYESLAVAIAAVWWISLNVFRTRSTRVIGHGTDEYRGVVRATWAAFAALAMLSVALKVDTSRLYIAVALPAGLVGLLVWRKLARVWLHRRREAGHGLDTVLVIGGRTSAERIAARLDGQPRSGYRVGGVWVPDEDAGSLRGMLARTGAGAVMVTDTEHLGPDGLRELTWQLEGTGIEVMLSPNVIDVVGSRLHLHEVSGLPMLHLDEPQYAGAGRFTKTLFDRVGAALILLAASPVLLVLAVVVKLSSNGPVFYRQERIGKLGQPFDMIKFRSMRVGADAELAALMASEGQSLLLAKLVDDPRVTRVGKVMRRYSLDELPQLLNVLKGDMSLVGPRPQRDFEVEQYDHMADRRLTVRPGMTGLWQVSGRSDLDFAEAIRLDVHYVENWSMTGDLTILWKTFRAVLGSDGAY